MKQGSGKSSHSGGKVEPKSHGVNPAYTAQLGTMLGNHVTDEGESVKGAFVKMHQGRGYSAPENHSDTHHCGSQGRHK